MESACQQSKAASSQPFLSQRLLPSLFFAELILVTPTEEITVAKRMLNPSVLTRRGRLVEEVQDEREWPITGFPHRRVNQSAAVQQKLRV